MTLSTTRRSATRWIAAALGVLVAATLTTAPAYADTQLPTPAAPVATDVTTTSVTFSWTPSPVPVAGYTIQAITTTWSPWRFLASTTGTTFTHTDLKPDSVYQYRIIANPVGGSGSTASNPSPGLWVRTAPLPDSVPPTTPGKPQVWNPSTIWATVNFGHSTDNNRVDAYWLQRQVDGAWTDWATNSTTSVSLSGLTPSTSYTIAVVAVDANGNRSPRSQPTTFTTAAVQPEPTCRAQIQSLGWSGVLASVTIENRTADTTVRNWTLTFTFPTGHTVTNNFGSTVKRNGTVGTATPQSYNANIPPGNGAHVGFVTTSPPGAASPSGFTLNSDAGSYTCTVA